MGVVCFGKSIQQVPRSSLRRASGALQTVVMTAIIKKSLQLHAICWIFCPIHINPFDPYNNPKRGCYYYHFYIADDKTKAPKV